MACCGVLGCSDSSPGSASLSQAEPAVQARFITIPEIFSDLKRPPVRFNHDRHTATLEEEGCQRCHRVQANGDLLFTYSVTEGHSDADTLMHSFHDDCIGCHTKRVEEGKKAGAVICGDCHVVEQPVGAYEYLPVMPDYYEALRDTYHAECLSCHREPEKVAEDAGALDWKSFYIKHRKNQAEWPRVIFDYLVHDKHDKALKGKCELCHYIAPARLEELQAEGREPAGRDWVWDVDEESSLTGRTAAHSRCVNCHLRRKAQGLDAGPIDCGKCHAGLERSIAELAKVARPNCEQENMMLIQLDQGARAKAVTFNHKTHEAISRSCQECHHRTVRPCQDCHTVEGGEQGGWITLAEAYHDISSSWSCVGCHEAEKSRAECAGCHQLMPGGLVDAGCRGCHTGSLDKLQSAAKLQAPEDLFREDLKDKLELSRIEDAYGPSMLPHLEIARKLTDISNGSQLASHFHTDPMTVCKGCHHLGPLAAKAAVPSCATCHTARDEPISSTPTLLGAYHQQCLGCHQRMGSDGPKMPLTCTGCHEEKPIAVRLQE
jgi:hypothetical protein